MIVEFIKGLTADSGTVITFAGLFAYVIAQGLKVMLDVRKKGYFERDDLFDGGGMPSSHTAVVVAMSTVIAWTEWLDSHLFSLSLVVTAIVIYDAMNIRYYAGEQARILNQITKKLSKHHDDIRPTKFKHPLGHTPAEVAGGIVTGIASAVVGYYIHARVIALLQMWVG